jgi:hypothetical protein
METGGELGQQKHGESVGGVWEMNLLVSRPTSRVWMGWWGSFWTRPGWARLL